MIDEKRLIEDLIDKKYQLVMSVREEKILDSVIKVIDEQLKEGEWISVKDRLPGEYRYIDPETGYYDRSDKVLCYLEDEDIYWIDYTIDGEWQCCEYFDRDKMYWMPLPEKYRGDEK